MTERPWWSEDNKVDFEAEGFRCAMRRGPLGSWCGYVGVPKEHPWHGKSYSDTIKPTKTMLENRDPLSYGPIDLLCASFNDKPLEEECPIGLALSVHGGLTYADDHEPYGKPDGLWWFGFDCAHSGDGIPSFIEGAIYSPNMRALQRNEPYRTQSYVVAECQSLAAQLAKASA